MEVWIFSNSVVGSEVEKSDTQNACVSLTAERILAVSASVA